MLDTLKRMRAMAGMWLEVTTLLIPGKKRRRPSELKELAGFIAGENFSTETCPGM